MDNLRPLWVGRRGSRKKTKKGGGGGCVSRRSLVYALGRLECLPFFAREWNRCFGIVDAPREKSRLLRRWRTIAICSENSVVVHWQTLTLFGSQNLIPVSSPSGPWLLFLVKTALMLQLKTSSLFRLEPWLWVDFCLVIKTYGRKMCLFWSRFVPKRWKTHWLLSLRHFRANKQHDERPRQLSAFIKLLAHDQNSIGKRERIIGKVLSFIDMEIWLLKSLQMLIKWWTNGMWRLSFILLFHQTKSKWLQIQNDSFSLSLGSSLLPLSVIKWTVS